MAWWWHTRSMVAWSAPTDMTNFTSECMVLFDILTGDARFTALAIVVMEARCATVASFRHTVWIERMSSIS